MLIYVQVVCWPHARKRSRPSTRSTTMSSTCTSRSNLTAACIHVYGMIQLQTWKLWESIHPRMTDFMFDGNDIQTCSKKLEATRPKIQACWRCGCKQHCCSSAGPGTVQGWMDIIQQGEGLAVAEERRQVLSSGCSQVHIAMV